MSTRESTVKKPETVRKNDAGGVNVGSAERWASALAGGALAAYGVKRKDWPGAGMALAGAALVGRGVTGRCSLSAAAGRNSAQSPHYHLKIESVYTIDCPPRDLYTFWRDPSNLPRVMTHVKSVTDLGGGRTHWVASAPAGRTVEWEAEIINDVPNQIIAWQSLEGSDIENAGSVRFQPAPGGRGTELQVTLEYNPPGGTAGALIAKMFGQEPNQQVDADLRRFKQLMEAGEAPTTEGQPTGKSPGRQESDLVAALHPSR
jgi:uncharacterized membrane protein